MSICRFVLAHTSESVASLGLFMDIVGIALLFRYGAIGGMWIQAGDWPEGPTVTDEIKTRRNKRVARRGAWLGLGFAVTGFVLQIVAQWL